MNKSVSIKDVTTLFCNKHLDLWGSEPVQQINLPDKSIDALSKAALKTTDKNFLNVTTKDLPECSDAITEIREAIFQRSGAVVVSRFPVENYETSVSRRAAGILSNLLAPLMAQDVKQTLLYDVIDEGRAKTNTTRRSKTNEEQPFHTDGPWFETPPNIIGLFCVKPADTGGFSQVSSLQKALMSIINDDSQAPDMLSDTPLYWNKMGQHEHGEEVVSVLPVIEMSDQGKIIRHYPDYVRSGCKMAGEPLDKDVNSTLTSIASKLSANACDAFRLEAGEFQYVNNWNVAHARAKFSDSEVQSGRHLVRLWCKPLPTA